MKYYVEDSLSNFNFWSGAKDRAALLSEDQFDQVEDILEEIEPEGGWSDMAINDFFWFDFDTIAEWLGYKDEEYLEMDISNDDIEEANQWFEDNMCDPDMFNITGLNRQDYISTDEDGEDELDYDQALEDCTDWWDEKSDIEKIEIFRKKE